MPLCGRAIEILDAARALGDGPLVFSREDGKLLDENITAATPIKRLITDWQGDYYRV